MPTIPSNASENLAALRLFVRVAQIGSFSKAARELGLSQPTVSRIVATLEKELGIGLFTRTTRALSLTEAGADYLARIEPILEALNEANHALSGATRLRGVLRIGVSSTVAFREIIPRLPRFAGQHPGLRIEVLINDRRQDLILEGVDIAIRLGALPDSTVVARKIATLPRIVAASPDYLARMGIPETPAALASHDIITGPVSTAGGWLFRKDGRSVTVKVKGPLSVNLNEGAIAAAVAGMGVVATGMSYVLPEISSGSLVQLLPDWEMDRIDVHAVHGGGRTAKPAARAFADFLVSEFKIGDALSVALRAVQPSLPAEIVALSSRQAAVPKKTVRRSDMKEKVR
jgi:DNA-binding transcriptional LysR family regulator